MSASAKPLVGAWSRASPGILSPVQNIRTKLLRVCCRMRLGGVARFQSQHDVSISMVRAEPMDEKVGYSIACQAEVEATTGALKLQDKLPRIQAQSLLGVVAKLEIIAGADGGRRSARTFEGGDAPIHGASRC